MVRVAYIDHSFHMKTQSTQFLAEILERYGHTVTFFWDEAWSGGKSVSWSAVENYDAVIMFQAVCDAGGHYFRKLHPNVTFIPMLDQFGICFGPLFNLTNFWRQFQGCKVINFSSAAHAVTTAFGIQSHFARYYQPLVDGADQEKNTDGLHGFFWLRREGELPWKVVRELIAGTHFSSFHLHLAPDPGSSSPTLPSDEDIKRFNIKTSTWFEKKSDLDAVLSRANVYFAPRLEEGIGQSFLEAFGRSQCVVAPNEGTMNEYILDGVNGLLYDWKNPKSLNFEKAIEYGAQGRLAALRGRNNWERGEARLVEYIGKPSEEFYAGKYQYQFSVEENAVNLERYLAQLSRQNRILKKTRRIWWPVANRLRKYLR